MSGPTKKELQKQIEVLEGKLAGSDERNLNLLAERSLLERKCDELSRELERVRSQNRALSEAEYEAQRRYAALLEKSQKALGLTTQILSEPLPSNAPSQDIAAMMMRGEL